ncbi:hypothetical protein [Agromyces sp. NPDC057865]|uniref:hypothetical protein n=1 Tax=Agromyces sp. NPDC057865 TaxID=3346267 RepID=UPI00366C479C
MSLIDEDLQLVLAYIAAANRAGADLSTDNLRAFADNPRPRPALSRTPFNQNAASFIQTLSQFVETIREAEHVVDYLTRVAWIDITAARVTLTPLGRAVLAAAERPIPADPSNEPLTVIIDPHDPLSYARIFDLMTAYGRGLLVDPYLSLDGLADLISISEVDRALTSDRNQRRRLDLLAHGLGAAQTPPEVRTVAAEQLHDRFFIPDDGPVFVLGSSLNTISKRPGVVTPVADPNAGSAIRETYARIWNSSEPLRRRPMAEDRRNVG